MNAPKHSRAYRFRRGLNWMPLGLAYAFFYMGRYNLTVAKSALGDAMTKADFGTIFAIGAWVYGISFLITGPLTDKIGGRRAMLIGTAGSILANTLMGLTLFGMANWGWQVSIFSTFAALYALNMHFQSYGAISIVTVKAPWFHVRERGKFSTIFGWMITLGVYFAFDWSSAILRATRGTLGEDLGFFSRAFVWIAGTGNTGVNQDWWLFFTPAILMGICWITMLFVLRNTPGEAGFKDFDVGEESVSKDGETLPIRKVFHKIITHPVLLIVCGIEFCSGILRNGIMHWYYLFAREIGIHKTFYVTQNWGLCMLMSGIVGAFLTGWASDRYFQSRRAPMSAVLYALMGAAVGVLVFTLAGHPWWAGGAALLISMSVIGVHGILSGTATADFAGTKNTGAAVGIVDGMVYLGTGVQSVVIGQLTPTGEAAKDPSNWTMWPVFLLPFAVVGFGMSLKIWNALPKSQKAKSA